MCAILSRVLDRVTAFFPASFCTSVSPSELSEQLRGEYGEIPLLREADILCLLLQACAYPSGGPVRTTSGAIARGRSEISRTTASRRCSTRCARSPTPPSDSGPWSCWEGAATARRREAGEDGGERMGSELSQSGLLPVGLRQAGGERVEGCVPHHRTLSTFCHFSLPTSFFGSLMSSFLFIKRFT